MSSLIEKFVSATKKAPFPENQFTELAVEVRERIISTISKNGGHLASSLGVVELTIALLSTFKADKDRIVWDVGHQGYAWKLLTGREAQFASIRKHGGLSGFLKRHESKYDAFDAGHAGTSISVALGMAAARDRKGSNEHIVAVIGDASFSNGLSLEALNNVASTTNRLIVILNDNEMSISENVGALSRYFGRLLSSARYNRTKRAIENAAKKLKLAPFRGTYYKIEHALKGLFVRNGFVESLGLRYVGPIDGHDFKSLMGALAIARDSDRPILLHIATTKGKGYKPAENEPDRWHGVGPFDVATGAFPPSKPGYSAAFGNALTSLAKTDERIVAITAAMSSGTGLDIFAKAYPKRFFDVGICEEHAATFAGGLAASGMRPYVALYSTFAQRTVDNIFHDICLQNLPVTFCLDRAGIVGSDGPTHHGLFDIALLRTFPNIVIMQPRDEVTLARMLKTSAKGSFPSSIRYPRGRGPGLALPDNPAPLPLGKAEVIKAPESGNAKVWIWALGDMLDIAESVSGKLAENSITSGIVDPQFIKPLDVDLLTSQAKEEAIFVTIENGALIGGFGTAVLEALSEKGLANRVLRFGWPDKLIAHGTREELLADYGLDADSITKRIIGNIRMA